MDQIQIRTIAQRFKESGYQFYAVGGCVRDEILGIPVSDWDFCTDAEPTETWLILKEFGKPHILGMMFGTICLDDIDITTFRKEMYDDGSRFPYVEFGTDLYEDLLRRDFTINAIAKDVLTGQLIDPFDGLSDLSEHIINAVGDPISRFLEDPLRLLRAIRFSAKLGFVIGDHTWMGLKMCAEKINTISAERKAQEFNKILTAPHALLGLSNLSISTLLPYVVPELDILFKDDRPQGVHHTESIWQHTLKVVDGTDRNNLILRWAALLHDIGKPKTRTEDEMGIHFYEHEHVGSGMAVDILLRLKQPNSLIDAVEALVENHMRFAHYTPQWTDGSVRRLILALGDHFEDGLALARADRLAHKIPDISNLEHLEARVPQIQLRTNNGVYLSPLDGNELMDQYGWAPGPWIKEVKSKLAELVIEGIIDKDDKSAAWTYAEQFLGVKP